MMIYTIERKVIQMTFQEVIDRLNNGTNLLDLAKELNIERRSLENKLATRAIVYVKENEIWEYKGNNPTISLQTAVTSRTVTLDCDKAFVDSLKVDTPLKSKPKEHNVNMEYQLFLDYKSVSQLKLDIKKTILVNKLQFTSLKQYSELNGLKLNQFIATLIKAGLDHYQINLKEE
ncbi:hypothetical protein [Lysinibacillus boronitolerans]|uniref:hypothetical protein n=1 Tax=Lysinibacillus boronitolerans TaxID=309788 RepID=UPI0038535127